MSIFERGKIYWYKFMWNGELIRESTKQRNDRKARNMESAHRTALANGLVGIRERRPAPALADFLKSDFLPFAETKHAGKPLTLRYYKQGSDMLTKSSLGGVRLHDLTDQHAQEFARKHSCLLLAGPHPRPQSRSDHMRMDAKEFIEHDSHLTAQNSCF